MPKVVDHDLRREQLLDASLSLFAEQGYHALSVRKLALGLGVSTGTLYHYFDSKEALFEAMLRRLVAQHVAQVSKDLDGAGGVESGMQRLTEMVHQRGDELQQALQVALDAQRSGGATRDLLLEVLSTYRGALEQHLGLPIQMAQLVLSAIFGLLVQRLIDPVGCDLNGQLAALRALTR